MRATKDMHINNAMMMWELVIENKGDLTMNDRLNKIFGKPDYSHIVRDETITISITAEEMSAVLWAYDRGVDELDDENRTELDSVIAKIKYEVWS